MAVKIDLQVKDIMSANVITLVPEMTCDQAAEVLLLNKITGAPVVDDRGVLIGVISLFDLLNAGSELPYPQGFYSEATTYGYDLTQQLGETQYQQLVTTGFVSDYMSRDLITAYPDEPIEHIADRMFQYQVHRLIVIEHGQQIPIGVVSTFDLVKCLRSK